MVVYSWTSCKVTGKGKGKGKDGGAEETMSSIDEGEKGGKG